MAALFPGPFGGPPVAKPDTILAWYRRLIAHKFDGSRFRTSPGRLRIAPELEALIVRFARENSGWGYDRIVGALANLGRERKRLIRLLVEDVTLNRAQNIILQVWFRGGAARTLTVPLPRNAWQQRATNPEVVREIDRLLEHNTYSQIASTLNGRALLSGEGKPFTSHIVARIRREYGLASRYDRLRRAGMLTLREMATLLGITPQWVRIWHRHGILRAHAYTDKNECLYEHPGDNPPCKAQGMKLSERVPCQRGRINRYTGGAV